MPSQFALPLTDPLEPRVLPQDAGAWFTLNRAISSTRMIQHPYRLPMMPAVLRAIGRTPDVYMSQGTFAAPTRRAVDIAWMTHGYVDLDSYRDPRWHALPPDTMVREIVWHCADADIPPPSLILFSGRGYYAKWFWSAPIPRAEVGRAVAVNRTLTQRLAPLRADPPAVDVSRILRVVGTTNSKSGRPVEIIWWNGPTEAPATYAFDAFARDILPHAEIEPRTQERTSLRMPGRFPREPWHWGVLEDIRALARRRYPDGIVLPGARDLFGHLAACQLAMVVAPGQLFHEIVAICREFLPAGYIDRELAGHCSTLLSRARRAGAGERVRFAGTERSPVYTYGKARLIDLLGITAAEEAHMKRLVSDGEKRRRETERRRAAGMMERGAYEGRSTARRGQARALREQGMTYRAIAEELGVSIGEAHWLVNP
jgi:hypothetical protein